MSANKIRYEFHKREITRVQNLVETYNWLGGMILYEVLRELPGDMLIHIHFQIMPKPEFRRITCYEALEKLQNSLELLMRVSCIQRDMDYGHDPECPIAIREIPDPYM